MAAVLGVFLRMLRGEGAVLIIRENLEDFSAKLIADLTKIRRCVRRQMAKSHFWLPSLWDVPKNRLYDDKLATFREFLDKTQYTEDNVASYEWIFGKDFISPGGIEENRRVLRRFRRLRPGQKMLDIGVGIGGGARQAAREFGLQVLGCDLSSNMIQDAISNGISATRQPKQMRKGDEHTFRTIELEYQIADAMVYRYEPNSYDIVFSRDCIQHIQLTERCRLSPRSMPSPLPIDAIPFPRAINAIPSPNRCNSFPPRDQCHPLSQSMQFLSPARSMPSPLPIDAIPFPRAINAAIDTKALFRHIYTWLKPGGQLLLTMYGKGHGVLQPKFHEYVRKRQYMLKTLDEYRETAHGAGFTNIFTENMTPRLREILEMERSRAIANGDEFVKRFGKTLYDKLLEGWMDKLQFIDDDNQNWLLLRAEKPVHPHAYLTEAGA
ncbi:hypothetical protein niasHT_023915 [Heterodera trifolii]|uniref:phosphoethanolamine N-methyltransferase n=1 Tax=Heterodera trifolii TaxID=157864 RepID=A0ABD2JCR2_9BILA